MKIISHGVSKIVLEVNDMKRAVDFWSGKLGFPIIQEWGYSGGQFSEKASEVWATWLPRNFNSLEHLEKDSSISSWNGLFNELTFRIPSTW